MFHTTKHDNSGPAIEPISALCKWPCRRAAEGSRVGTATSRHDGRSTFAEDMERETNDEEKKLILITSFSPFVIYEWKKGGNRKANGGRIF